MRRRNENRATMEAYDTYTIQGHLLLLAVAKWLDLCMKASLVGDRGTINKATKIFEKYAISILPEIIAAKKFMGEDYSKDQRLFDAIKKESGDSIGVYSLEDILKDFTTKGE